MGRLTAGAAAFCLLLCLCACAPEMAVEASTPSVMPTPTVVASPIPTAVPAPANPFDAFLAGDLSVLEPEVQEYARSLFLRDEACWEYVFLDLDGDGADELFLRWDSSTAVFHEEDGGLLCWSLDTIEAICYEYPLMDGRMVEQYDYNGSSTYSLFRYNSDGSREWGDALYTRWETVYPDDTRPCPYYEWNGGEISHEQFETYYQERIGGGLVTGWEQWTLSK